MGVPPAVKSKAVVFPSPGQVDVIVEDVPELGPDEVQLAQHGDRDLLSPGRFCPGHRLVVVGEVSLPTRVRQRGSGGGHEWGRWNCSTAIFNVDR